MAEHVAQGDGAKALDVGHGQAGGIAELEQPQGQHENGTHNQLGDTDAPWKGDRVKGFLLHRIFHANMQSGRRRAVVGDGGERSSGKGSNRHIIHLKSSPWSTFEYFCLSRNCATHARNNITQAISPTGPVRFHMVA